MISSQSPEGKVLYHRQRNRLHCPERNRQGDCLRVAIACVLDRDVGEVPPFSRRLEPGLLESRVELLNRVEAWLGEQGLTFWTFPIKAGSVEEVCEIVARRNPHAKGRYLVMGRSTLGFTHVVCCKGDAVEWNANPARTSKIVDGVWPDGSHYTVAVIGVIL